MAQTLVSVSVLDVNDNCPVFVDLPYYSTVPVDASKGDVITKACAGLAFYDSHSPKSHNFINVRLGTYLH